MSSTELAVIVIACVVVGVLGVVLNLYSGRRAKISSEWVRTNLKLSGWVQVLTGAVFLFDAATGSEYLLLRIALGAALVVNGATIVMRVYRPRGPARPAAAEQESP